MRPACILARHIKAGKAGAGIRINHHTAHKIMRGRHHLDKAAGQVKAAIGTALDHAGKFFRHNIRAKMCHRDINTTIGRGPALAHFFINSTADNIARRPFASVVIIKHKTLLIAIDQMAAGPAQAFFQHRTGHFGTGTCQQAGRMELHHFHITQRQPAA